MNVAPSRTRALALVLLSVMQMTFGGAGCKRRPPPAAEGPPRPTADPLLQEGRVLYDFLANRPLALIYEQDALVIPATQPDLNKFIDGGWKASLIAGERDRGGRPIALADGVGAALRFPGLGLGAPTSELLMTLTPAPDVPRQAVTVLLNERIAATLELQQGTGRYRVPLSPGRVSLSEGENLLRLHFRAAGLFPTANGTVRSAASIERITIGPPPAAGPGAETGQGAPPGQGAQPLGRTCAYGIGADARQSLCASGPTRWSYSLIPPTAAAGEGRGQVSLHFGYGVQTGGAAAEFSATLRRDGEPEKVLFRHKGEPGRWQEARAEVGTLAALGGRAMRIDLSVTEGAGGISGPRLVLEEEGGGSAQGQEAMAGRVAAPPRAEHLVVLTVDALRADRVPGKAPLPSIAALLQQGVRVPATTQGNYGLPAHASLLSGTYPAVHRLLREVDKMPDEVPLLPEVLSRAGFATGLFSASGYVSERWGLSRGFDTSRNLVREGVANSAAELWRAARPFLEEKVKAGRRVFLYLASADPHAPYAGTPPRGYTGPLRSPITAEQLLLIKRGKLKLTPQDRAFIDALYDAEVAATDAMLGQVLAELSRLRIADRTAIVLVGTHGEEFFDHGSVGHGHSLYQELISVPLLISFPPRIPPGQGQGQGPGSGIAHAELVDIAPTLLHLLGAAVPESMQGESLLPLLDDPRRPHRPGKGARMPRAALSQHDVQGRSLQIGRYKLIATSGDRLLLFDLARDPHEQHDIAPENPVALRALRNPLGLLLGYNRRWRKGRLGSAADLLPGFYEELGR
jgi:arylsulfatase A-like enzyme